MQIQFGLKETSESRRFRFGCTTVLKHLKAQPLCLVAAACCLCTLALAAAVAVAGQDPQALADDRWGSSTAAGRDDPRRREPTPLLRTGPYTLVPAVPDAEQQDPLQAMLHVDLGAEIATLGQAIEELLSNSGYQLDYPSRDNCLLVRGLLFAQPLPAVLRRFGPVRLRSGLEVLAGAAWEIRTEPLGRRLQFVVRPQFYDRRLVERRLQSWRTGSPVGSAGPVAETRFFAAFGIAEFSRAKPEAQAQIRKAAALANAGGTRIRIRGHSHSRAGWATDKQALRRAEVIGRQLIEHGVSDDQIVLEAGSSNGNSVAAELVHGAEIFVAEASGTSAASGNGTALARCNGLPSEAAVSSRPRVGSKGGKPSVRKGKFEVSSGSLRGNIHRLLDRFGMRMGHWGLIEGGYEFDWDIPFTYEISAATPEQALESLLKGYGIQPTLNLRDNSVDFATLHTPSRSN